MIDADEVAASTGWHVVSCDAVDSTNDELVRLLEGGAPERTVVVADRQTAGRGRGGHLFSSPPGGLYLSLHLRCRPRDLPAPVVAAVALASAEALESSCGVAVQVKWPNDLWIEGKKVAGLLAEARGAPASARDGRVPLDASLVVGIGINVDRVPADLSPPVARRTTAVGLHARSPVRREEILTHLLTHLDREVASLEDDGSRAALETRYRARLALVGERVRFLVGSTEVEGVLRDVSLDRGLGVEGVDGRLAWHAAAHVREVRRAGDDAGDGDVAGRDR